MSLIFSHRLWLMLFLFWATTLYFLSSFATTIPEAGPEIPHLDKMLHFGYFFGGGGILATFLLLKKGLITPFSIRILLPMATLAVIGALDEYNQTFTPGRSGNDPFDWLADVLGAAAGILLAHKLHPHILRLSSVKPYLYKK